MASELALTDPVEKLAGVGPAVKAHLEKLHIFIVRDLLFHLPHRYLDRTKLTPINRLLLNTDVVIEGRVLSANVQYGRRRSLLVKLADETGQVQLRFFHFSKSQQTRFAIGRLFRCFGEVRRGPHSFEMAHPECHIIDEENPPPMDDTLTPIYPLTEGIQQTRMRRMTDQALATLRASPLIDELVPEQVRKKLSLPELCQALQLLHRPPADADLAAILNGTHLAQQRLAFEELLAHQLSLKLARKKAQSDDAISFAREPALEQELLRALGFSLTNAQNRVIEEIQTDLSKSVPMLRLLQGDVGSGKTAVAAFVALSALGAQAQVCLMAPTELLADQHHRNFTLWFEKLNIPITSLTGKLPKKAKREAVEEISTGGARIIIGTHALFQHGVEYPNLGLIIVDEQHRFGVDQRLALRDKGKIDNVTPHQLIMTATPIPRTLAMTAYADLDVSIIDELPPSRTPVNTVVLANTRREEVIERIGAACRSGRQAYWVCPLIDESEALEAQAATETVEELRNHLPEIRIGLIHGRLADTEKEAVMADFSAGKLELLVATTVIEVGVDVPNASLMIIDNAERLGLSQIHQLRGRVGRGAHQSDCLLLYKSPLGRIARARLECVRDTTDGFVIAERDLELRGPGEVLGTRQAGIADFRIADIARDRPLLPFVNAAAESLIENNSTIANQIIQRWLTDRVEYGNV
ncbi:MAG: ATP-dependent DNA helicase RecG [Gammaproteobacteria bacterium]